MSNGKLNVVLNNYIYENNSAYAAVGIGGGCVARDYIIGENESFRGNYAFFNVLSDYWKIEKKYAKVKFNVDRAVSFLSFESRAEELLDKMTDILESLLKHKYRQDLFEEAKKNAKASFSDHYKDPEFRARYKSFEFLDLNKRFLLSELNRDIERIGYEEFSECAKKLIVPDNLYIYVTGDTKEIAKSGYERLTFKNKEGNHAVQIKNFRYDPYLRQDAHIAEPARENADQFVAAFDFLNPGCSTFAKNLIIDIYAEKLKIPQMEICVDSCDAGILYTQKETAPIKDRLISVSEDEYEKAQKAVVKKYIVQLQENPEIFATEAVRKLCQGIHIEQYIAYIEKCPYEKFTEICSAADYKITEAQVSFRKEIK